MNETDWDVLIVGGSAAGLSAALMLGRARRRVVVVDGGEPRNRFSAHMHGVLGYDGRDPADLIATGRGEVSGYGVELMTGSVEAVDEQDGGLTVTLTGGQVVGCRALIVTTGVDDELPDIAGLAERWGTTVLHCPYCHGWEVRGRRLGVLATSPLSLHQVQLVRQWSEHVVFFNSGAGSLDADTERRLAARGVEIVASPVVELTGDAVTTVRMRDGRHVEVDALFTMGVLRPRDGFLAHLHLERTATPMGSFLTVDKTGRTSHPRIWAAGNVTDPTAGLPMVMSAGASAGALVNMALVTEEFDAASAEVRQGAA